MKKEVKELAACLCACMRATRRQVSVRRQAVLIFSGLSLTGGVSFAVEWEVLDRFSVDGYSEFRGTVAVPGGGFAVGGSTFVVKSGNIGIGTSNPGSKLEIFRNPGGATDVTSALHVDDVNNSNTASAAVGVDRTQSGNSTKGTAISASITPAASSDSNLVYGIHATAGSGTGSPTNLTTVGGYFSATGGTNNYGLLVASGNVGIGTTSPDAGLAVISNTSAAYSLAVGASATAYHLTVSTTGGVTIGKHTVRDDGTIAAGNTATPSLARSDFGKTFISTQTAATDITTYTLPAVTAADVGAQFTFIKKGIGKVVIQAPAATYIADSSAAGTIYNAADSPGCATITIRLASDTLWVIIGGDSMWTTQ